MLDLISRRSPMFLQAPWLNFRMTFNNINEGAERQLAPERRAASGVMG
jgi:hypothetical protein